MQYVHSGHVPFAYSTVQNAVMRDACEMLPVAMENAAYFWNHDEDPAKDYAGAALRNTLCLDGSVCASFSS